MFTLRVHVHSFFAGSVLRSAEIYSTISWQLTLCCWHWPFVVYYLFFYILHQDIKGGCGYLTLSLGDKNMVRILMARAGKRELSENFIFNSKCLEHCTFSLGTLYSVEATEKSTLILIASLLEAPHYSAPVKRVRGKKSGGGQGCCMGHTLDLTFGDHTHVPATQDTQVT